jgi:carbon storage regulator CsrA
MLVLQRRVGEKIILDTSDGRIEICLVDLRHVKARIGVDAPDCVTIHRDEIWRLVNGEQKEKEANT